MLNASYACVLGKRKSFHIQFKTAFQEDYITSGRFFSLSLSKEKTKTETNTKKRCQCDGVLLNFLTYNPEDPEV